MKNLKQVVYVSWEESERGWGTRPDGCTLHMCEEDYKSFEREYWKDMLKEVPDEYSRPCGKPIPVKVSSGLYKKIQKSKNGIFVFEDELEKARRKKELVYGTQRSGWMPLK